MKGDGKPFTCSSFVRRMGLTFDNFIPIHQAAKYFRIGEKKLRKLAEENPDANWLIMNGNRIQIKRRQFEKVIDSLDVI